MKRIIILAVLAAFALTSCQQELTIEENKPEGVVFRATTEIPATKTALDASLNVIWQENDEIAIMSNSKIGIYKTTAGGATNATFVFETQTEATVSPFMAWYPTSLFSGTTFVLPATQTYVAGNISGNSMYAESSTTNLSFKNLCGIIKLNISTTQTGKKVSKIVLSADQGMSGVISNAATLASDPTAAVSGTDGVTLDCGTEGVEIGSTAIPFYIAVPAYTYSNLKITVITKDGEIQARTANSSIVVDRSSITNITLSFGKLTATTGSAAITGGGTQEWVQLWAGGPKWAKFNVGSDISSYAGATEYTTSTIGGYYSFRANGTDDSAKYIWGDNWVTPSQTEMKALIDNCTWTYCNGSEVQYETGCTLAGWKVSGKDAGYTENSIFLPSSGIIDPVDGLLNKGTRGCFWSSDPYNDGFGYFLELFADNKAIPYHDKSQRCSVRAILTPLTAISNLVHYWPFNGNTNDDVPSGTINALNSGATLTTDRFGNANSAYYFDGTGVNMSVAQAGNFDVSTSFTFNAWINTSGSTGTIIRTDAGWGNGWFVRLVSDGKIEIWERSYSAVSATSYNDEQWHMVTFVRDVTGLKGTLYVDGAEVRTYSMTEGVRDVENANTHYFGVSGENTEYYIGKVDEVRLYNKALTAAEVAALYNY